MNNLMRKKVSGELARAYLIEAVAPAAVTDPEDRKYLLKLKGAQKRVGGDTVLFVSSVLDAAPEAGNVLLEHEKDSPIATSEVIKYEELEKHWESEGEPVKAEPAKTMTNTTAKQAKEQVSDLVIWGDGDMWKLLSKASSQEERWMKSSKAMEIAGVGCVVQVTTQQGGNVAEAVVFVPNTTIKESVDSEGKVIARKLVKAK